MPHLTIGHVHPDLALAAVVSWALLRGATEGAVSGFLAGIALDLLSGAPFGLHTFVMTMVGGTAGLGVALVPSEHAMLVPGMAALCTLVQLASQVWLLRAAGWPLSWSQALLVVVLPSVVVNVLLTVLLFPLVGLLDRRAVPREPGW